MQTEGEHSAPQLPYQEGKAFAQHCMHRPHCDGCAHVQRPSHVFPAPFSSQIPVRVGERGPFTHAQAQLLHSTKLLSGRQKLSESKTEQGSHLWH